MPKGEAVYETMRSGSHGVQPLTGRGLLFLLAFVSFLTFSVLGPHAHGESPTLAMDTTQISEVATTPVGGGGTTLAPHAGGGGESLGFAAACVLVLLLMLAVLATRRAPERAAARPSWTREPVSHRPDPRGSALPLFLLFSISRT